MKHLIDIWRQNDEEGSWVRNKNMETVIVDQDYGLVYIEVNGVKLGIDFCDLIKITETLRRNYHAK